MKREEIKLLQRPDSSWTCTDCPIIGRTNSEDSTDDDEDQSEEKSVSITTAYIMDEMKKNQNIITKNMNQFKKEIQESIQFISDSFEEMRRENAEIKKQLQQCTKRLINSEKRTKDLERKIKNSENEKRMNNVAIMNVPKQPVENMNNEVGEIIEKLGLSVNVEDFHSARVSNKDNSPILVKLRRKGMEI